MSKTLREAFGLNAVELLDCKKIYDSTAKGLELIDDDRAIGIEVEVENHQLTKHAHPHVWVMKGDGSLRNQGVEYVTQPIAARYAPAALEDLLSQSLAQSCCFSPRTSIHVHINVQDLQTNQVVDVVMLYTMIEELFYKFTGRGRIKNIYCVPIFDTALMRSAGSNKSLDGLIGSWSKYSGLNLCRLTDLGTLEFRHMHGTFDVHKVSIWIRLICKLVQYVQKVGTEYIRRLAQSGEQIGNLLPDIFGNDTMYLKYETPNDVKRGMDAIKLAFVTNKVTDQFRTMAIDKDTRGPYFTFKSSGV